MIITFFVQDWFRWGGRIAFLVLPEVSIHGRQSGCCGLCLQWKKRRDCLGFFVGFIEDRGARANLIFQAAATEGAAFPAPEVQAVAAVAIFFFINVTDDELDPSFSAKVKEL